MKKINTIIILVSIAITGCSRQPSLPTETPEPYFRNDLKTNEVRTPEGVLRVRYSYYTGTNGTNIVHGKQFDWTTNGVLLSTRCYQDGELHGLAEVFSRDGEKRHYTFNHGESHGPAVAWYPSGQKMYECTFVHGRMEGPGLSWSSDGSTEARGIFKNGEPYSGTFIMLNRHVKYSQGKLVWERYLGQAPNHPSERIR